MHYASPPEAYLRELRTGHTIALPKPSLRVFSPGYGPHLSPIVTDNKTGRPGNLHPLSLGNRTNRLE